MIDAASRMVIATVAVAGGPASIALDFASRAYVASSGAPGGISILDTATNSVVSDVGMATSPNFVAVEPGGERLFVAAGDAFLVMNATTLAASGSVFVPGAPFEIAPHPVAHRAYLASALGLHILDTRSLTYIASGLSSLSTFGSQGGPFFRGVQLPALLSATYDSATGVLAVTGTGLIPSGSTASDIVAAKFTFTGKGGATYTLTDTADVDIASDTAFTLTLSASDRAGVAAILDAIGTQASDGTVYNLAADEDWAPGAIAGVTIADLAANPITVTNASGDCRATPNDGAAVYASANATAVQAALNAASAGTTVKVAGTCAGVQTLGGTTQSVLVDRAITLEGGYPIAGVGAGSWTAPPDSVAYPTVLDAQSLGRVIYATAPLTLRHLTVRNGLHSASGGGIRTSADLTLDRVILRDNVSGNEGGGIYQSSGATLGIHASEIRANRTTHFGGGFLTERAAHVVDSLVVANQSGNSGGGGLSVQPATVVRSEFRDNHSTGGGSGGLYLVAGGEVSHTRFIGNRGDSGGGGGIFVQNGALDLRDSLFSRNDASVQGTAITSTGNLAIERSTFRDGTGRNGVPVIGARAGENTIRNSIIAQGSIGIAQSGSATVTQDYILFHGNGTNLEGAIAGGADSLDGDPRFADAPNDDLRLFPGSAAFNAGDPGFAGGGTDLAGHARVAGGRLDIGAYEARVHVVTPSAGSNGTISPPTAQHVMDGGSVVFTLSANTGYTAIVGGSCGGTLVGNTYTTSPVTANCTVEASFTLNAYTVTASAGANGTITPSTPQTIGHGGTAVFTVTPNVGYAAIVGGSCGGTLAGTTYTTNPITANCTVEASFDPNPVTIFTGPSPAGTGMITASFTGGGPACTFTHAQFIPVEGDVASPPAGTKPPGVQFPHGLFDFRLEGCTPGSTIAMTIAYPAALPADTSYWKYGPTPWQSQSHWYVLPMALSGSSVTFGITDGGTGDDDLAANGTIVDQGGPGTGGAAATVEIPTLSEWALVVLATMMMFAGLRGARRRLRR